MFFKSIGVSFKMFIRGISIIALYWNQRSA